MAQKLALYQHRKRSIEVVYSIKSLATVLLSAVMCASVLLPVPSSATEQTERLSHAIATLAVKSTLDPFDFEQRLDAFRSNITDGQKKTLKSCLNRIYNLGANNPLGPPKQICINGRCSSQHSPLSDLSLWAASMSAALQGTAWTQTTSGSIAAMSAPLMHSSCKLMPEICDKIGPTMYVHVQQIAKVCD